MRLLPACLVATLVLAAPGAKAAAEFRASYGDWRYDISGSVTQNGRSYDLQDDLALQPAGRRSLLVEWDTGPGWFPDLSLAFNAIGGSGQADYQMVQTDILGNPIGTSPETIDAAADFDDYDLTARYPLQLGAVSLGLGLTLKKLSGEVFIDDSGNPPPDRQRYSQTVPELHLALRAPLVDWLALSATTQAIRAGGNSALEWRAVAELRLKAVMVELGWQEKRFDLDLGGHAMDARLAGALLRGGLSFR